MRPGTDEKATRLNLLRSRRRLARIRESTDLLKRKREALVRELLGRARPAVDARERIAGAASVAYPALVDALSDEGHAGVLASGQPAREVLVEAEVTRLWGLTVASATRTAPIRRTLEARGTVPGVTSAASVEAAEAFESLSQLLVETASQEMMLRRLGRAVARTSRQVRALELRVEPTLSSSVARMSGLLDEREREEQARLRLFLHRARRGRPGRGRPGGARTEADDVAAPPARDEIDGGPLG